MSRSVEYISSRFAKLMHNNDDAVKYMYEKQNALMTHYFALVARRGRGCPNARTCLRLAFANEMRENKDVFQRSLRSWGYCS